MAKKNNTPTPPEGENLKGEGDEERVVIPSREAAESDKGERDFAEAIAKKPFLRVGKTAQTKEPPPKPEK